MGIMLLWDKCAGFRRFFGGMFGGIKLIIGEIVDLVVGLAKIIWDALSGSWSDIAVDGAKMFGDMGKDWGKGFSDAIDKGKTDAALSTWKFGNMFDSGGSSQTGPSDKYRALTPAEKRARDRANGSADKDNAKGLSGLGASGGLGEAKNISIRIDTLQKNNVSGVGDFKKASEDAIDILIAGVNNLSFSQSGTM